MPNWTPEQKKAIKARNHTILVSAAAGSGKTAVLIERIVQLIREGYSLGRMLIVTFTKAAAGEMRQRLTQRLLFEREVDPVIMESALDELEYCEISTIHAFCTKMLRSEFQAVGIDPLFRICEENDRQTLFELAFCDAMNDLLEDESDQNFMAFADAFEQQKIREMTTELYTFLMSMPEPFAWLEQQIENIPNQIHDDQPWRKVMRSDAERELDGLSELLSQQQEMFREIDAVAELMDTWEADSQAYARVRESVEKDERALFEHVASFEFVRAATCRGLSPDQKAWQKRYQKLRDEMKKLVKDITQHLSIDQERCTQELTIMQQHLKGLQSLIRRVHAYFLKYKQQKNVVDFSDLEQFTYQILQNKAHRDMLQSAFDHIFVDECQDVSAIQDSILQAIHGEKSCMFMVGDVKQSIYRFRLADPTRFLHRMRTFSDDKKASERRIFLQKNFRSRTNVLDATNLVFRRLMKKEVTELDYLPEDELIPGRETENDPEVEIHVIDAEGNEDEEKIPSIDAEAALVIEKIRYMLTQTYSVGDGEKAYTYRDMVILLPKVAGVGGRLVELLGQAGIPVYFDGSDSYFSLPEIVTMKSLLSVIDNPLQDVELMAALKTIPFCMTDEDLSEIRLCKTGRGVPFHEAFDACCEQESEIGKCCREVREKLAEWRFWAENMRLSDFIWKILRESGYYAACGALPKGELRQANLRLLSQRAAEYESSGGCTLSGFLELAGQQQDADDKRSAKMLGENENLVRIMTMHKSKGLEFPVVFCMQLSGKLHRPQTGDILMHSQLGVALPYVNRKMNIRRHTIAYSAFDVQRKLDEKAERARLLYVAMTRAREKLYLIGCTPEKKRGVWAMRESSYRIMKAESMMDWLMQACLSDEKTAFSTGNPQPAMPWKIRLSGYVHPQSVDKEKVIHSMQEWLNTVVSSKNVDKLWTSWQTLYDQPETRPLKTSVSSLAKKQTLLDPLPLTDEEESLEDKRREEQIIAPLRLSELPSKPAFMEERRMTGAERGTLVHRVLSLVPLERMREAENLSAIVHEEVHAMVERGQITAEELMRVPMRRVMQFFGSDVGQRLLRSDKIRREWSFNLLMEEEGTLLQGVIDCAFMENGRWILLDYKTDRIEDENAFVQRYTLQMQWYARALERITGIKVDEIWLCALSTGIFYAVEKQ
ncbi:MAG: helicase-exonuclease AddAB subunit AddA [Clostridia bacterium]|nr:helicase-exonuclease AddAB subunit AddA [Clostridia bacterium]